MDKIIKELGLDGIDIYTAQNVTLEANKSLNSFQNTILTYSERNYGSCGNGYKEINDCLLYLVLFRDNQNRKKEFSIVRYCVNCILYRNHHLTLVQRALLAQFYKFPECKAIVSYATTLFISKGSPYFTIEEVLNIFEGDILLIFFKELDTRLVNILSNKKLCNSQNFIEKLLDKYINKHDNTITITALLDLCHIYNIKKSATKVILNIECPKNIIKKIFGVDIISFINENYDSKMDFNNIILNNIVANNWPNKISDDLYLSLIKKTTTIWKIDPRISKEVLGVASSEKYYDIIIEHLNSDIIKDVDINPYIANLFTNKIPDYNDINLVLKNCSNINVNAILDNIKYRLKNNYLVPELLINYIPQEKVDHDFLKKCLRIGCYIKDLERFNIPYDETLYRICSNYYIFPDEYMAKMTIDKNILEMRLYYYKNKNYSKYADFQKIVSKHNLIIDEYTISNYEILGKPEGQFNKEIYIGRNCCSMTPYTILRSKVKYNDNCISKLDDDIINVLNVLIKN